jgi:small-conductance mechanosensitive channel
MVSNTATSKVKAVIENVEHISNEVEQLQGISTNLNKNIKETLSENDKNLELQEVIDQIGQLDKTLSYLYFIEHIENLR